MLKPPRLVWLMLTSGDPTRQAVERLAGLLAGGDVVVDGSNSRYTESAKNHALLKGKGIRYLDAGCSGGPSGALKGMSLMVGGERADFEELSPLFRDLSVENGYGYIGPAGSGHFVKMVHNAIEYGMMQSLAEGLELVAEGPYREVALADLCNLWNNGSVIRGYLVELSERAFRGDPALARIAPYVEDNGEGRWSVEAAVEYGVPFGAIANALFERFASRSEYRFGHRVLAALRHEFGGHEVKTL